MILLNIFFLILVIAGLFLFAHGLSTNGKLSVLFGSLFVLVPLVWLTIGNEFIALAPILALVIIYVLQRKSVIKPKEV
ncbi:hypothetical protein [Jeotgalicoccus halotolerans]|uniref:Uncharacterized protein n=1 Tax=Jeotgalicoccus halotolerans TaxID=157227 RepID=A0A3E0B381_9STAP|nr:hypothetical protein [Jeotgalicoccus halotolerans]REG26397.1 hypothetical protein DFR63_0040 [Jeotgalicoccus halotolerans]